MSQKDRIIKGKTTRQEVVELMGEPYNAAAGPSGTETLRYYYKKRTLLNDSASEQRGSTKVIQPHFTGTGVAYSLDVSYTASKVG